MAATQKGAADHAAPRLRKDNHQSSDERLVQVSLLTRTLRRPEIGAAIGALMVFLFFTLAAEGFVVNSEGRFTGMARWLDRAAPLGIMAVAVSLLMIGGEFDLSSGVMTGSTGLVAGLLSTNLGINIWVGMFASLCFALLIGFLNGMLVIKTSLPSFIVTLSTFFILRGANLGVTKLLTGTVRVEGIGDVAGYESARLFFASTAGTAPADFSITILWWIVITIIVTWILHKTRIGNWIFSSGGDSVAARNIGVPAGATKIALFMYVSASAWLVGITNAIRFRSVQAGQGIGLEFMYIIAAVVGGCLLTGGFGSAIGGSIGALIMGMAFIGIPFAGWNTDWQWLFVGILLLSAVLINNFIRVRSERSRS